MRDWEFVADPIAKSFSAITSSADKAQKMQLSFIVFMASDPS